MDKLNKDQQEEMDQWINSSDFDQMFVDKNPSPKMDQKFYEMIASKRKPVNTSRPFVWFLRLALPIGLLVLTFYLGSQYASPAVPSSDQSFAAQLLTSENVNDKISLVSNTKLAEDTDKKVIDALLFSLSNDESVNVRLACINTLYDYAYLPIVRTGLIQAISSQQSPIVLTNLAQAINASGKKLSKEAFMELINKDLPRPIKKTIDASLITI
jgi:hypothetical protein